MALDVDRIKRRQEETRKKEIGDRWQPKEGVNRIRVFKFSHKVTEADVKAGLYADAKKGKTVEEVDRPMTIHFNVHPDNRPVMSNPDLIARYKKAKASGDDKMAKQIGPQTKYALNVVDTDEKPAKLRTWMCPKTVYNEVLGTILDADYGEGILGSKGRDFIVKYDPKAEGTLKYSTKMRDKDKCVALPEELDKAAIDFYSPKGVDALGIVDQKAGDEKAKDEDESDVQLEGEKEKPKKGADKKKDEEDEDLKDGEEE